MRELFKCYNALRFISRKMTSQENLIAVCQMTARSNKVDNLKTCELLIEKAATRGAKMVFLPEACDYIGENKRQTLELAEPVDGQLISAYCEIARKNNIWVSLGGVHEKVSEDMVRNSHVVINSGGEIVDVYSKTHLFDVELPDKNIRLKESDYVEKGHKIAYPLRTPVGSVGLCICYDMRFAELGIILRGMGADILTFPSAFTQSTGASHWEVLLRARAIETQCYVVAAAQTGAHNLKRSSWGHAMIVDPWGTIVAQCSEGVDLAMAVIDHKYINRVRSDMPVWEHRRYDLYAKLGPFRKTDIKSSPEMFQFGESTVKAGQIFYETEFCIGFTNKRCVLPGHVLVAPKRVAKRLSDLTQDEVTDLFRTVTIVQKITEQSYAAKSSTISLQDGVDAGQTVEHVHVHIIPRKPGDFTENDDIYKALEKHDKKGVDRSETEMFLEAENLRRFI